MRQTQPLPDTHPEFTIHNWPGFTEYRVEHWRLARDGSGRIVRGTCIWSWVDACAVLLGTLVLLARFEVLVSLPRAFSSPVVAITTTIVLTSLVWTRFTQVLHESLLVFPTLGIQLETHLGHPLLPLTTTHHFIPLSSLEDVIIHEGFRRWNVRFYLAALYRTAPDGIRVRVAFENVLPYFPVLKMVYLGVQQSLFPPPTRIVGPDGPVEDGERGLDS